MTFKKALFRAAIICLGLPVVLPFLFGALTARDYLLAFAIIAGIVSILSLIIGALMAINPASRVFGQALMLTAGMMLLLSFTLCSTS